MGRCPAWPRPDARALSRPAAIQPDDVRSVARWSSGADQPFLAGASTGGGVRGGAPAARRRRLFARGVWAEDRRTDVPSGSPDPRVPGVFVRRGRVHGGSGSGRSGNFRDPGVRPVLVAGRPRQPRSLTRGRKHPGVQWRISRPVRRAAPGSGRSPRVRSRRYARSPDRRQARRPIPCRAPLPTGRTG